MNIKTLALSALLFAGLSTSAHALPIELGPDDADTVIYDTSRLSASDVGTYVGTSGLIEYYKSNVETGDEKDFASSYDTEFSNTKDEPSDALIKWVEGTDFITCPDCYLLVKDGDRPQYLFNLGNWDGQAKIKLQGFYTKQEELENPEKGAISHISIFGKAVEVTEPGTFALLGLGIVGLTLARRRSSTR